MKRNINNEIYKMYEEEYNKNKTLSQNINKLKLELYSLKCEISSLKNKINKEVEKATEPLIEERDALKSDLSKAYDEIDRLKKELIKKDGETDRNYQIDKLIHQVNKNSTNSGIPTSKEIKKQKTGANLYNHREKKSSKTGGQFGHKGETFTKEKLIKKIKENHIPVNQVIHYIKGTLKQKDIVKYKIGMQVNLYVEEHIFKHVPESAEVLPKEYYSDVTYNNDLKSFVTILGNYYALGF